MGSLFLMYVKRIALWTWRQVQGMGGKTEDGGRGRWWPTAKGNDGGIFAYSNRSIVLHKRAAKCATTIRAPSQ